MDALKKKFREGHHAEAIAECEALCREDPGNREIKRLCAMMHALVQNYDKALELLHELRDTQNEDADILFNIGLCEKELRNFTSARDYFKLYTGKFPTHPHGWIGLAECYFELKLFDEGVAFADRAIKLDSTSVPAWAVRGNCQKALKRFEDALESYKKANQVRPTVECCLKAGQTLLEINRPSEAIDHFTQAIKLAPNLASARVARGDTFSKGGKLQQAVADFRVALTLAPTDAETLKKACLCLLSLHQGSQAIELCDNIISAQPSILATKLVREWVLTQLVPAWHVPMMNEQERNKAYYDALATVVAPEKVVFEIGTGSGLIAMMAAKLGARKIFTCETVDLIADTARRVVRRNNYQDQITVLGKPSTLVELGSDLPVKADILVHEIFSSDLLGENLLAAIEDAKKRLLNVDGKVLPSAASIMIALVGGTELGRHLHVDKSFGFDLRDFNIINGKMNPLFRYDLETILLSDDVEAFRFDFDAEMTFPAETREIGIKSTKQGLCHGIIQWIRIELLENIRFENHPSQQRPVANWQNIVHRFDEPINLEMGSVVSITAAHNQLHPWFELKS